MKERFILDNCGSLIDLSTGEYYDYVDDVLPLLNTLENNAHENKIKYIDICVCFEYYIDSLINSAKKMDDDKLLHELEEMKSKLSQHIDESLGEL